MFRELAFAKQPKLAKTLVKSLVKLLVKLLVKSPALIAGGGSREALVGDVGDGHGPRRHPEAHLRYCIIIASQ